MKQKFKNRVKIFRWKNPKAGGKSGACTIRSAISGTSQQSNSFKIFDMH